MLTILRRVLLLWLFAFWQGGFVFYGTVVVTIGSDVHGSDFAQGMITQRVAAAMNLTGLVVLLAWTWDLLAEAEYRKRRWAAWGTLLLTLAVLACLKPQMDALIDLPNVRLVDDEAFHHLHRWYLRVSTAQWVVSVLFTIWTLQAWRRADRPASVSATC